MNNLHLQSDAISQAKSDIIDKFFKNALWIDDSIIDDITQVELDSNIVQSHFDPFVKYVSHLAERGITCALKGYNPREECDDGLDVIEIAKCANLAKKSDIVFLDWHLSNGGPLASLAIINEIIQNPGFKIIIIITAHTNWYDDITTFYELNQEKDWLTNGKGTYITHIDKGYIQGSSSFDFWDAIKSRLLEITPNILSWIALGLSAEIKEFTPRWISTLPEGVEFATCMHQIIIDNPSILTGDFIIKNLFEDLKHHITTSSIPIANNDTFSLQHLKDFSQVLLRLQEAVPNLQCTSGANEETQNKFKNSKNKIAALCNSFDANRKSVINFIDALTFLSMEADPVPLEIKALCNSCKTLTTFSENLSLSPQPNGNIRRGNVYTTPECPDDIYLCISQECDCIRATSLTFLLAKKTRAYSSNKIHVFFKNELYSINLTGSSIIPKNINTSEDGRFIDANWDLAGCLRKATVDKITHDFWQNSTRIGVDIPEFERLQRK